MQGEIPPKKIREYPRRGDMSNEEHLLGCLGYVGDYTTQLYGDKNQPWNKDPY